MRPLTRPSAVATERARWSLHPEGTPEFWRTGMGGGLLRALRPSLPYLALLVALLWMSNFFWFIAQSQQPGGSALNGGFVRDGHYFLALHGTYTEVTQAVWERVRLHELTVWVSLPLAVASMGYWLFGFLFPKLMHLRHGPVVDGRVQSVRTSGEWLASGRCTGSIGGVSWGAPLVSPTCSLRCPCANSHTICHWLRATGSCDCR
jgi:hypothetical protein